MLPVIHLHQGERVGSDGTAHVGVAAAAVAATRLGGHWVEIILGWAGSLVLAALLSGVVEKN